MDDEVSENNKRGFKVKIKRSGRSGLKLPIFCPNEQCKMITSSPLDNEPLEKYGVCLSCFVNFIENRKTPLIEVEFFRKRLKDRGF